jgi:hypothetical protein
MKRKPLSIIPLPFHYFHTRLHQRSYLYNVTLLIRIQEVSILLLSSAITQQRRCTGSASCQVDPSHQVALLRRIHTSAFTLDAVDRQQHPGNALPLSLPIQPGHSQPPTVAVLSATPTLTALSLRILVCLFEVVVVVLFSLRAVPLFGSVMRLRTPFSFFFSLPLTTRAFGKTPSTSSSERGVSLFDLSCIEPA